MTLALERAADPPVDEARQPFGKRRAVARWSPPAEVVIRDQQDRQPLIATDSTQLEAAHLHL